MTAPLHAALLMIDMQNGFIDDASSLCVAGAKATLPMCARVLDAARASGIPVIYVTRAYAADGSNVEAVRYHVWAEGGKPISSAADSPESLDIPSIIEPQSGDYHVVKPRFSAFFETELTSLLGDLAIDTVVLAGTTTPNCIRTTCYDALSFGYNVVIIEDATSSRTPEVQQANIDDMEHIGAQVIDTATFCTEGLSTVRDIEAEYRKAIAENA